MHLLHLAWRTSLHLSGRTAAAYRIRKCWLDGAEVGVVGAPADLTYPYTHFGQDAAALRQAQSGGKGGVLERLKAAQRPAVLVGPGVLHRPDRDDVLKQVRPAALPPPRCSEALDCLPRQQQCRCTRVSSPVSAGRNVKSGTAGAPCNFSYSAAA